MKGRRLANRITLDYGGPSAFVPSSTWRRPSSARIAWQSESIVNGFARKSVTGPHS